MDSLAFTICASWFGALLLASLFLPIIAHNLLIAHNQKHEQFLHIRAAFLCLCTLGNAIGCTSAYASVHTSPLPSELIFLIHILQGISVFEVYWILEVREPFGEVFGDRSWKWKTHVFPCALFLFGALAGLAVVLSRCFLEYYLYHSYR